MQEIPEGDEQEIGAALVYGGKNWEIEGKRKCIPTNYLTTEYVVWFNFIRHTMWPTTHDTTLSRDKWCLLFCIVQNLPINLGLLISQALYQDWTRKKVTLPLPCLITALLINARVPMTPGDVWMTSATTISLLTLKKMGRIQVDLS